MTQWNGTARRFRKWPPPMRTWKSKRAWFRAWRRHRALTKLTRLSQKLPGGYR